MRREAAFSSTAGTNVPVPEPFSRIPSHGRIMLLDSLCQIHDTSLCFAPLERGFHDTASLLSFAPRRILGRAGGRGGVPDVIYRGGVEGAQSGGVPRGQIIRSVGRLILSANLRRRRWHDKPFPPVTGRSGSRLAVGDPEEQAGGGDRGGLLWTLERYFSRLTACAEVIRSEGIRIVRQGPPCRLSGSSGLRNSGRLGGRMRPSEAGQAPPCAPHLRSAAMCVRRSGGTEIRSGGRSSCADCAARVELEAARR